MIKPVVGSADVAAEEAAFAAAFNAMTDGDKVAAPEEAPPPPVEEPTDQSAEAEQAAEGEAPAEPEPAPEPAKIAGYTEDELRAALARVSELDSIRTEVQRTSDKLHGKLGELNRKIEAASKVAGGFSPKARARLKDEFPELERLLFDGAEDTPGVSAAPMEQKQAEPQAPQVDVGEVVSAKVTEVQRRLEERLLKRDHPDWEQVVASREFGAWAETLPQGVRAQLLGSLDADYVSGKLNEFKGWRSAQEKKTKEAARSKSVLASAITPSGDQRVQAGGGELDEEEKAFQAAFLAHMR